MMQRLRVRYTKEDRVRFVSARDLTSVWERALRRARLPIAYSEGFTPHPKVSFPDALPLGYASTGEYAELTFADPIDPGPDLARLSANLPQGMDITTYAIVPDGARKLASHLTATLWELVYADLGLDVLRLRTDDLLARSTVEVVRRRPKGDLTVDVRPALLAVAAVARESDCTLRAVLRNDAPTIRPTDVHAALLQSGELPQPRLYRRVAQGTAIAGGLTEALTGTVERVDPDVEVEAA